MTKSRKTLYVQSAGQLQTSAINENKDNNADKAKHLADCVIIALNIQD